MNSDLPSVLVLEEVARKEGVPPEDLSPRLNTVVDADALDKLVQSGGASPASPVEIAFEYCNYTVLARNDGEISVSVRDTAASPDAVETMPEEGIELSD